ncbi:hypothetical protein L4X63_18145 [Geomonas sp. Red32]|uniref:hypothetical protein n=1 Tax=Geomonas sp. Red32 TaxID=2912856 RepID=UPI00202CCF8C|nr:hypothetical protein [Geomonas sp. Red32]MCM0083511.1 hypothetical protein [Geomonas sp. Red32]
MKKLLLGCLLGLALAGHAYADDNLNGQIDDTFVKAKTWLSQQNLSLTGSPSARDDNAAFTQEAILFYGEAVGNPDARTDAQREMGAKRAAVVVAQRAVAEYLNGFALVGDTLVKDGMLQYDSVRSAVSGIVKGVQVVVQDYSKDKDTAIAILKLGMHGPKGFASSLYEKLNKDPHLKKAVTELDGKPAPKYRHKPEKLDEKYDGLIVDATEQDFKPALINRIFSAKKELLYDPSKVSQKVLVEQGCGEYTNTVDKAKAALEARGIKNPLVIKAVATVTSADLQVSDQDAVLIFSANQQTNFLAGAKVAFVLK